MKRKAEQELASVSQVNGEKKIKHSIKSSFNDHIFDDSVRIDHEKAYAKSKPYKHGMIQNLIDDSLLRNVREEIQANLSFTPKETDIYKIHQSGDLANLDGLDDDSLKLLPSLKQLRDALYSQDFRNYLCGITGSKAVSGRKTDMAINVYTPGCHLLCHDDVIGSRRISYILYLTDSDHPWKAEWGGALRLYATKPVKDASGENVNVPEPYHIRSIPPAFNQLSFFAVQPGESFHDVEEVYAEADGADAKQRTRMAISGWYHIPQVGEEGYEEGEEESQSKSSSLAQLQGRADIHDRPESLVVNAEPEEDNDEEVIDELTKEDLDFLLEYISPIYLTPDNLESATEMFDETCAVLLDNFLCARFAERVKKEITASKNVDDGITDDQAWQVARPPHKHRYLYSRSMKVEQPAIYELTSKLLTAPAFHKWLRLVTGHVIKTTNVLARRFRRGKDYTLAQAYTDPEPRLELCLAITPSTGWCPDDEDKDDDDDENPSPPAHVNKDGTKGKEVETEPAHTKTEKECDPGGYLVYMAGEEDDEDNTKEPSDPAIYQSGSTPHRNPSSHKEDQEEDDDDDDGILFSMPTSWNKLSIILRDKGTMRFVKYVSASAPGDRWDIFGEFGIDEEEEVGDDELEEMVHGSAEEGVRSE